MRHKATYKLNYIIELKVNVLHDNLINKKKKCAPF